MITPTLIFLMLFFTFCRIDMRQMRLQRFHLWMMLSQLLFSLAVYAILRPYSIVLAQGGMICVLTPIAMAAVVIGGMLGADIVSMTTFSLLCNFVIALVAPMILHVTGNGTCSFMQILAHVAPLLITPFVLAQLCRRLLPGVGQWVANHSQISFYMWLLSLAVIIGHTTTFILDNHEADGHVETALAGVALVICLTQFAYGRWLGRRYGDPVAGGQSLGQKNTVLAVWMSLTFLDPISSVAPTAYIVWQNFVNSYQIYRRDQRQLKSGE
jgi:BASS family bile acid:Na+ symporter